MATWARLKNADSIEVAGIRSLAGAGAPFPLGAQTDTISELTPGAGVTIDGVLLKDGKVSPVGLSTEDVWTANPRASSGGPLTNVSIGQSFYNVTGNQVSFLLQFDFKVTVAPATITYDLPFPARRATYAYRFPTYTYSSGIEEFTLSWIGSGTPSQGLVIKSYAEPLFPITPDGGGCAIYINGTYLK